MRKNIVHYARIIDTYAPSITGSIKWNNDINMASYCATTDRTTWNRNILTISDEAFMLLCLINYGKRWFNELVKIRRKVREGGPWCILFSMILCDTHCLTNIHTILSPTESRIMDRWGREEPTRKYYSILLVSLFQSKPLKNVVLTPQLFFQGTTLYLLTEQGPSWQWGWLWVVPRRTKEIRRSISSSQEK